MDVDVMACGRSFSARGFTSTPHFLRGASHFCNPHPKSLSQVGRGTWILLPFSPLGRRGWGMRGFWRILYKTEMLPFSKTSI